MSGYEPARGGRLPRRPRYFEPEQVTAIYENPVTGWREGIPRLAWLWMFLFGIFYMAVRNLWRPFGLTCAILLGTLLVAWPLIFIVAPVVWVTTALKAQALLHHHYMRLGWDEINPWQQDDQADEG